MIILYSIFQKKIHKYKLFVGQLLQRDIWKVVMTLENRINDIIKSEAFLYI